ncbi:hypothetical protein R6Q57_013647 [Mikania cordata]
MPSGAKKRKAAKKKKVNGSSTTNPHQVVVEKKDDGSSENKSNDTNEEEGNIELEVGSKSKSSHGSSSSSSENSDDEPRVIEKSVVVVESVPNESVPAVEFVPEKIPAIVDPVKPVAGLLEEASQVFDDIENEKKKDLVVEETPVVIEEQTMVIGETDIKDDCPTSSVVSESVKENEVESLLLLDEKAYSVSKDDPSSSTPTKSLISEVHVAERANESDTNGHINRQALAASPAVAVQSTTTWKSCCGLFELFSGSDRQ